MAANKLDWALHWAGVGYPVFPVVSNGKRPAVEKAWRDVATTDPAQIAAWWNENPDYNIGCPLGRIGYAAVDVDPKNDGPSGFAALTAELGPLPRTFTVKTPSTGRHIWLKVEGARTDAGQIAPGVDVRGEFGYVVMPGSEVGGVAYEILDGAEVADCPPAWAKLLQSRPVAKKNNDPNFEWDAPRALERARAEIADAVERGDVAIEGGGGDDRTFRLFARLRDLGVAEETAIEMAEPWNAACAPPWDPEELAKKAANAYSYAQNDPGVYRDEKTIDEIVADIPAAPEQVKKTRFAIRPIETEINKPPLKWIVEGYIPERSSILIYGAHATFKSFLAVDLVAALASGVTPWRLDAPAKAPMPVLYMAAEGYHGLVTQRFPAWFADAGLPPKGVSLFEDVPRIANGASELEAMLDAYKNLQPRLMLFDTLARMLTGLDENSAQDMGRALDMLTHTSRVFDSSVIAIHHADKSGSGPRGSSALAAGVDVVFNVRHENGVITLRCEKMKDGPEPPPLRFVPRVSGPAVVLERAPDPVRAVDGGERSGLYRAVYAALTENHIDGPGRGVTTEQLAAMLPAVAEVQDGAEQAHALAEAVKALRRQGRGALKAFVDPDFGTSGLWYFTPPAE